MNVIKDPIEAEYLFPCDPEMAVSKMTVKLGDKEIEGKVMEKEKAEEKYQDAIAAGNQATMLKYTDTEKDVLKLTVGNVLPQQEVEVTVQVHKLLDVENGAYCLRIPTSYFPRYGYPNNSELTDFDTTGAPTYSFNLNIDIECQDPITFISKPSKTEVAQS